MFTNTVVIGSYSREEALNDGVLIDLKKYAQKEAESFKYPIACTTRVFEIIETSFGVLEENVDTLLYNFKVTTLSTRNTDTIMFKYLHVSEDEDKSINFKAICHPGDNQEPVITIMMPEED